MTPKTSRSQIHVKTILLQFLYKLSFHWIIGIKWKKKKRKFCKKKKISFSSSQLSSRLCWVCVCVRAHTQRTSPLPGDPTPQVWGPGWASAAGHGDRDDPLSPGGGDQWRQPHASLKRYFLHVRLVRNSRAKVPFRSRLLFPRFASSPGSPSLAKTKWKIKGKQRRPGSAFSHKKPQENKADPRRLCLCVQYVFVFPDDWLWQREEFKAAVPCCSGWGRYCVAS